MEQKRGKSIGLPIEPVNDDLRKVLDDMFHYIEGDYRLSIIGRLVEEAKP